MNSLIINKLVIFDPKCKIAKKIVFKEGINVITSSQKDGNKVGKSVIMKSIYHTLGADCFFDDMWKMTDKLYFMEFNVNKNPYVIFRHNRLFKIYKDDELVLATVDRNELSKYLSEIYEFKVLLPNRTDSELVLTPPSFFYLLNYTDQDCMNGTKFASFDKLGQFSSFKVNTIYNHIGIFNEEYFQVTKNIEELKRENKKLVREKEITLNMLDKVSIYLKGNSAPGNLEALEEELNIVDEEYNSIITMLNKIKENLINLRNDKIDLHNAIDSLQKESDIELKTIKKINCDVCPMCNQTVTSSDIIIEKSNHFEDLILIKQELEASLIEIENNLRKKQAEYANYLEKRKSFEKKTSVSEDEISNALDYIGYSKTRDNLLKELGEIKVKLENNDKFVKSNKQLLNKYNNIKKEANNYYYKKLLSAKLYFGLEEIDDSNFEDISLNFNAGGSNIPLATIMWHITLLNVKYKYYEDTIRFPIVFDSPNNVEADDTKKHELLSYIFDNYDKGSQLIVSTLGFEKEKFNHIKINNIINVENAKYNLLNEFDYFDNIEILQKIYDDDLIIGK